MVRLQRDRRFKGHRKIAELLKKSRRSPFVAYSARRDGGAPAVKRAIQQRIENPLSDYCWKASCAQGHHPCGCGHHPGAGAVQLCVNRRPRPTELPSWSQTRQFGGKFAII